jgi:excisionase family DNA binding protein
MDKKPQYFNTKEASEYLGVSTSCLNDLCRAGLIPFIQVSPRLRKWTKDMLDEYLNSNTYKK